MDNLEEIENYANVILNFFERDYLLIKDFLENDSPWDDMLCIRLSKTSHQLNRIKINIKSAMVSSYLSDIIVPICSMNKNHEMCIPDVKVFDEFERIKYNLSKENVTNEKAILSSFWTLLKNDNFIFIQLIKHYIHVLEQKDYIIYENNYNAFKYDICNIYKIYSKLQNIHSIDIISNLNIDDNSLRSIYEAFYDKLNSSIIEYINNSFRTNYEKENFISYILSIVYAYLNNKDDKSDEEELLIEFIKNNYEVTSIFDSSGLFSLVLENLCCMYYEYGDYYDFRQSANEHVILRLDSTFFSEKDMDKIDSLSSDYALESVLLELKKDKLSNDEIYNYLVSYNKSIYDKLYKYNLDPRFELDFKKALIRKIISDVFEYHFYLYLNEELDNNHYLKLNDMDLTDYNNVINYFTDNYSSLLEQFYKYHDKNNYFIEKIKLKICESRMFDKLTKINKYKVGDYLPIFHNFIINLKSVDYMNMCIEGISNNYENYNNEDIKKMLSCMCLNIYEHIIAGDLMGPGVIYLENYIEQNKNIVHILQNDDKNRKLLEEMFIEINKDGISYSREVMLRKRINDDKNSKVLKKLNPFNE